MPRPNPLIRTKLRLPFIRSGLVGRPRLQEQLDLGLSRPLTLITAPAGFGKTTLVASYLAECSTPVAWLSLDKNDNQAGRFLRYLVAALQSADPKVGSQAAQLLAADPPVPPESILTSLINDLDAAGQDMILVLDDYQFIHSQAVHEALTFLLEHCPGTLHLVIATRSDPPLPLARLRARAQTLELRAADLRFTVPEAAQFLNDVMGLDLDAGLVAVLEERTEGWIAGLQMAALSMRNREDIHGFIEGFSGTNRFILDYLLEEVLANQSPELQCFLLCTSILERLTAPLCETLLQTEALDGAIVDKLAAGFQPADLLCCQPILEYLDRANLFLVPLDDERRWYRYHHLFADLLRARLDQVYPDAAPQLHARAAAWHEHNGSILEAIQHASLAQDDAAVERLIEENYLEMVNQREMSEVRFWTGKLPKEVVYRRPWLCLYEAFSCSWFGQLKEANLLLNQAEKRILEESGAEVQAMLAYHTYVRSRVTAMQGDTQRAIELCRTARERIPRDNLSLQIETGITLGYEYFLQGDFINSTQVLNQMIALCHTVGAINNPVAAYALLARVQMIQGRLHQAYQLLQKAAQLIRQHDGQHLGVTGLIEVGLAALLCEWNQLPAAQAHLRQGLDYLPMWGKADDLCLAYATLARIELALGEPAEAAAAVGKAVQFVQTSGVFSEARSAVESAQVKLWLAQADWPALARWLSSIDERLDPHAPVRYEDEWMQITLARVLLAQDKAAAALRWLAGLEASARSGDRAGRLIEIRLLAALAYQALGQEVQAQTALTEGLALAHPNEYIRIFLDEGPPMQRLLADWQAHAGDELLCDYAASLLAQFDAEPALAAPVPESAGHPGGLIEPLSERELEVLQLIALGKTNAEVAQQLFVARGTVKAHTSSIYRKLDVANRTQAVARARQLGILP